MLLKWLKRIFHWHRWAYWPRPDGLERRECLDCGQRQVMRKVLFLDGPGIEPVILDRFTYVYTDEHWQNGLPDKIVTG